MASPNRNLLIITQLLPKNLDDSSILDCGCGYGTLGFLIRARKDGGAYIEGFDLYKPYIDKLKLLDIYDRVYEMDIMSIYNLNRKYDYVFALEIFEHINRDEAFKILPILEGMCNKMLIISTPIGYLRQGVGEDGNIHQIHQSSYRPKDFKQLGYETKYIYRFTKILRIVQIIRCWVFGLDYKAGNFVAWKRFD